MLKNAIVTAFSNFQFPEIEKIHFWEWITANIFDDDKYINNAY